MTSLPATTSAALVPFQELERMARAVAASGLFGIKTADQAIALMLIAQAEGRHPAIVARDYDIIQGRPAKKAEAMLRDFMAAGGSVDWHKLDETIADATFSHPQGGKVRITWTMEQAQRAGLASKATWKQYPRQMLRSRCVSEGCRTVCPQSTSGMYDTDEVRDFAQPERRETKRVEREIAELPPPVATQESPTPLADALLPPPEEKRSKDAWKDDRALDLGFEDRRAQSRAVYEFTDDLKGFGLTPEWAAKRMLAMQPPRKTLWGLQPQEIATLHAELRKAGDSGERFKTNGKTPPEVEFAPLPDDGIPF